MAFGRLAVARSVALVVVRENCKPSGTQLFQDWRIVADVLGISVAEEDSKSRVRIRQVHRGNLRPIRTAEFQDRSTVSVSRLLGPKNQPLGEEDRHKQHTDVNTGCHSERGMQEVHQMAGTNALIALAD